MEIACGLPVIAFAGLEIGPPITEAAVVLYSPEKSGELVTALLRAFQDRELPHQERDDYTVRYAGLRSLQV